MPFQALSEETFVRHLTKMFAVKTPLVGIGDDAAVILAKQGMAYLVTTDALVEGVHFLKEQIPPKDLGFKTVAVNVSDISAMGGEPKYAFLSIAIPKTVDSRWAMQLMEGVHEACKRWGVFLLGGDTVGSLRDIFINLALVGCAKPSKIKYRHGAKQGDIVCVSGFLGDSGGGLKSLQENREAKPLVRAHFRPSPCPQEGIWLASHAKVHAMMDVSDGLQCDLKRLLQKSKCGAAIDLSKIPISNALKKGCRKYGWDLMKIALTGGEDYCLLLTIAPDGAKTICDAFSKKFEKELFPIGRIEGKTGELIYTRQGKKVSIEYGDFDHFE